MARPFIGLISDTHGLVRPQALDALSGASLIIHAGDIGPPEVLQAFRRLAPVVAVRGNMDFEGPCAELRRIEVVEHGDLTLYVLHDGGQLDLDPKAAGLSAVVSGHTHRPQIEHHGGVLYVNPGPQDMESALDALQQNEQTFMPPRSPRQVVNDW